MNRLPLVSIGLCIALAAGSAWADGGSIDGRWTWNQAESTTPPGEPGPDDVTLEISRSDSTHLKWSITVVGAQGEESAEKYDAIANGEFQPVSRDTIAAFRLGESSLQATFKGPNGETDTRTCTVAADRMTCKGAVVDSEGEETDYVDVYDRM
jgi:hypothetical protein